MINNYVCINDASKSMKKLVTFDFNSSIKRNRWEHPNHWKLEIRAKAYFWFLAIWHNSIDRDFFHSWNNRHTIIQLWIDFMKCKCSLVRSSYWISCAHCNKQLAPITYSTTIFKWQNNWENISLPNFIFISDNNNTTKIQQKRKKQNK